MSNDYHKQAKLKKINKLNELLTQLPPFMKEYFRGIQNTKSETTRVVYAYDLRNFFYFLITECSHFYNKNIQDFTLKNLGEITTDDIEDYMHFLNYYSVQNKNGFIMSYTNENKGKSRKLASVRALFKYFYKKQKIKNNPSDLVDMPKIKDKSIIRLELNEIQKLIDEISTGTNLTTRQQKFHQYTRNRDLAIITLLLGTGLRISECVGINLSHIDFNINGIKITRKGGNEVTIYFGDEVRQNLLTYILERTKIMPTSDHEDAFFLSLQKKRLTDRAIQNLVKKYANLVNSLKNISPHKLRSTYGTNLYRATRDIYLVADVLGHRDVNTTRKHYAQMDDERRKDAVNFVKFHE